MPCICDFVNSAASGPSQRKSRSALSLVIACMVLFLRPTPIHALEPLTLQEGIQRTLRNNPALKASDHALEAAEQEVLASRGGFLPKLNLSESFQRTTGPGEVFWTELSQERFSLSEFSASNPNDPAPITNYNTRLTFTQPIYNGGRIRAGYRMSKFQREAVRNDRERTRQEIIREFTAAYFDALLADRFVRVAEQSRAAVQAHMKTAQDLLEQGMALRSDLLRARVRLSEVEAGLVTARNRKRLAAANLNRIMGADQDEEYALSDVAPVKKGEIAETLDQLIDEAKRNRPDLTELSFMEQTAEQGVKMARAAYLPSLNFVAQYNRNDRDFGGNDGEYWTIMATADLNLFEGFSSKARIHRAKAEKARMANLVRQAVQRIELEVRRSYLNLQEARDRLEITRRAVAEAEESLKIVEGRYATGMERITELLDTETALTLARTHEAKARYDLDIARTDLDLALGRL
jgi:outer membrane protein